MQARGGASDLPMGSADIGGGSGSRGGPFGGLGPPSGGFAEALQNRPGTGNAPRSQQNTWCNDPLEVRCRQGNPHMNSDYRPLSETVFGDLARARGREGPVAQGGGGPFSSRRTGTAPTISDEELRDATFITADQIGPDGSILLSDEELDDVAMSMGADDGDAEGGEDGEREKRGPPPREKRKKAQKEKKDKSERTRDVDPDLQAHVAADDDEEETMSPKERRQQRKKRQREEANNDDDEGKQAEMLQASDDQTMEEPVADAQGDEAADGGRPPPPAPIAPKSDEDAQKGQEKQSAAEDTEEEIDLTDDETADEQMPPAGSAVSIGGEAQIPEDATPPPSESILPANLKLGPGGHESTMQRDSHDEIAKALGVSNDDIKKPGSSSSSSTNKLNRPSSPSTSRAGSSTGSQYRTVPMPDWTLQRGNHK